MALTEQEQKIVEFGKSKGKSKGQILAALSKFRQEPPQKEGVVSRVVKDIPSDIRETGQALSDTFSTTKNRIQQAGQDTAMGEQTQKRGLLQTAGLTAGALAKGVGEAGLGLGKLFTTPEAEERISETVTETATPVIQKALEIPEIKNMVEQYQNFTPKQKRDLDAILGGGSLALELLTGGLGGKAITRGSQLAKEGAETIAETAGKSLTRSADEISQVLEQASLAGESTKQAVLNFVTPDIDENIAKILQRVPTEKFDEAVNIARVAKSDPEAITLFEKAGDRMQEATKQLEKQRKSITAQKETILNKAKTGLVEFKDPTRRAILEVRKLGDNPQVTEAINILKNVKTKIDADRAIDRIQDFLYTGNRTQTIPQGSTLDKRMRGIIGKYNQELKDSLPASYGQLNTQASNRIKAVQALNSSLGEVVDGVATRGASLIKQFFSPSGRKAKELFDYVNKNTGVDLAQDATLAKYMMEIFDDPRSRSLLEGIPRSKSGVLDTVLDFAVEKTGVGEKARETVRSATINKAREATKK